MRKTIWQKQFEIEEEYGRKLRKENGILAYGSLLVMFIQMIITNNFLIWGLVAIPIVIVVARGIFTNECAKEHQEAGK